MSVDSFAVRDLWLTSFAIDFVFSAHALNIHFEMQLAHTGDDGLFGLGVKVHTEGGGLRAGSERSLC